MSRKTIYPVSLKIVTVEDSPVISKRLECMLIDLDYVQFAGNATNIASSLRLIDELRPDAVLLDIHLEDDAPAANGMDLIPTLRKMYADMWIMVLTNLSEAYYREKCIAAGADYFFDKSNDFDRITQVLSEIIHSTILHKHKTDL